MTSGRPSARVESNNLRPEVTGGFHAASANDSPAHPRSEVRRRRNLTVSQLDRITAALSDRDRAIVDSVANLRLVSTPMLQRLHFVGDAAISARQARAVLQRLVVADVLHRLDRRIGGVRSGSAGHVYRLGPAGQYVAGVAGTDGRRRRPSEPGVAFVRHTLAVAELCVKLTELANGGGIELLDIEAEPRCWRMFYGPGGARLRLKPDAFVRVGRSDREHLTFVEVDLGTESKTALATKFRTYRQYWASGLEQARWGDVFPRVLWLAPDMKRLGAILDVAGAQPPESWKLFGVRLYSEALDALCGEVPS